MFNSFNLKKGTGTSLHHNRNSMVVELRKHNREQIFQKIRQKPPEAIIYQPSLKKSIQEILELRFRNRNLHACPLANFITLLRSQDMVEQMEGIMGMRHKFEVGSQRIKNKAIKKNLLKELHLKASQSQDAGVQMQAIWTLTTFVSQPGNLDEVGFLIDLDFLPIMVKHLLTRNINFLEQIIYFIGSTASDFTVYRNKLLDLGVAPIMIEHLKTFNDGLLTRHIAWSLSTLCRGNPHPQYEKVADIIAVLCWIVAEGRVDDEDTVIDCCWAISYHCNPNKGQAHYVMETNLYQKIIEILKIQSRHTVITPLMRIINELMTGSNEIVDKLLQFNLLEGLCNMLFSQKSLIRRNSCQNINVILQKRPDWIRSVYNQPMMIKRLLSLLADDCMDVKSRVAEILCRLCNCRQLNFDIELVRMNFLSHMELLINSDEEQVIITAISALQYPLKAGHQLARQRNSENPFAMQMVRSKLMDRIRIRYAHLHEGVHLAAASLIVLFSQIIQDLRMSEEDRALLLPISQEVIRLSDVNSIRQQYV